MSKLVEKIIYETMGVKLTHLASGRPFFSNDFDISVSHKDGIEEVKIVFAPQRVGIDVENIFSDIDAELFLGSVITHDETDFLHKFCSENNFSLESAVAIFWSIKESFFKCLDYDLKPGKMQVSGLSKMGKVKIILSAELENIMEIRKLKMISIEAIIKDDYVYAKTIMEAA